MPAKKKGDAPNWRIGKFHNDNDEDNYLNEQGQIEKDTNNDLFSKLNIQEAKPMSKHANRRKKKKAGQVAQEGGPSGGQQPLSSEADPSLDDVK